MTLPKMVSGIGYRVSGVGYRLSVREKSGSK